MPWVKNLSTPQIIALILCFPGAVTISLKTAHPEANKAFEAAKDFSRSAQKCRRLGDCYEQAMALSENDG